MPTFCQSSRALFALAVSASLVIASTTACSTATGVTDTSDGLRYTSKTLESDPPFLLVDLIQVTNVSQHIINLTYGACTVTMRAYRSPDRSGTPIYDGSPVEACPDVVVASHLSPGQNIQFQGSVSAAELSAAGVPAGHYWFASVISTSAGTVQFAAGDANVDS